MSSEPSPHPDVPAPRSADGETHALVWFAGVMVLLLLIALAVFGVKIMEGMQSAPAAVGAPPPVTPAASSAPQAAAPSSPEPAASSAAPMPPVAGHAAGFQPPAAGAIPHTPMGDMIRQGEQIFVHTGVNAKAYVGNSLNCVNCHLDAGRLAHSAPMWGAYLLYPAYRNKTQHVDTFAERLRGCFMYSMNGKAPPFGDEVLVALESYAYWMATGAPVGERLPGAGFAKLTKPAQAPDIARGQKVFESHCALCHGDSGQGQRAGDTQVFPPLWGAQSFNWGAGMANIDNAAAFIKANMPLGQGGTLTDQQAWDVATFMDSHERPQDPRFTGDWHRRAASFMTANTRCMAPRWAANCWGRAFADGRVAPRPC